LSKPVIVARVDRSGRHAVVGRAITRIGRCERRIPRLLLLAPSVLPSAVVIETDLGIRETLVLGRLGRHELGVWRQVLTTIVAVAGNLGVDGGNEGRDSLPASTSGFALLVGLPVAPVTEPGLVVFAMVEVDVEAPAHGGNPLKLERVELGNGNATDLRPRSVLKCVVVQELAAQEKRHGKVSPDLALGSLVLALASQGVDTLRKVVEAKQNRSAGKSRRGENLGDKLAKRGSDLGVGSYDSGGHIGNVLGHLLDLVVEDSAHASGHFGG